MLLAREEHTATLLQNGKVLVAGGRYYPTPKSSNTEYITNTAELYDPTSGTFSATGSMTIPRINHVANLLGDGRVLITGGWTLRNSQHLDAEIYNPATGTFSPAANTSQTHGYGVSSSTLADGRILVAGAANDTIQPDDNYENLADIYDSSSSSFTASAYFAFEGAPGFPVGRGWQTTTLTTTNILLMAGGFGFDGNQGPFGVLSAAEIFEPVTNSWSVTAAVGVL